MIMQPMHNHGMSDKLRRWQMVRDLIRRGHVHSQEQLAAMLRREGVEVTQATLSRDLRELGVMKGPSGYVMGDARVPAPAAPIATNTPAELESALRSYLRGADAGGNLVVLRTGPGQASLLAFELDRAGLRGMMGTVAGDDTVLVATKTSRAATSLLDQLRGLASLR